MALRTSLTARSVGVPIWNWTKVVAVAFADGAVDLVDAVDSADRRFDPLRDLGFHLVGAAPGWVTLTEAAGKSMSGLLFTCMPAKAMRPASISPTNSTIGGTGLRMHQEEILRKFMNLRLFRACRRSLRGLALRVDLLAGVEERPGRKHDRFVAPTGLRRWSRRRRRRADLDVAALDLVLAVDDVDIIALARRSARRSAEAAARWSCRR